MKAEGGGRAASWPIGHAVTKFGGNQNDFGREAARPPLRDPPSFLDISKWIYFLPG